MHKAYAAALEEVCDYALRSPIPQSRSMCAYSLCGDNNAPGNDVSIFRCINIPFPANRRCYRHMRCDSDSHSARDSGGNDAHRIKKQINIEYTQRKYHITHCTKIFTFSPVFFSPFFRNLSVDLLQNNLIKVSMHFFDRNCAIATLPINGYWIESTEARNSD